MRTPDFILIGAPKGGTTSLYHYLRQHPQIYMSVLKDSHFFLHDGGVPRMNGPSDKHRRREMIKSWPAYQKQFAAASAQQICGEIGVRYLDSPNACAAIQRRMPSTKLILILRHPVERAWSHYQMYRRNGSEPCPTFEQALADEPRRLREGWFRAIHQQLGYYHQHLAPYYARFPAENIKVYLYDDLKADACALMRDLFDFLGVDQNVPIDMQRRFNEAGEISNPALRWAWQRSRGLRSQLTPLVPVALRGHLVSWIARQPIKAQANQAMPAALYAQLLDEYRDDIEQLARLIGRDLSHWLRVPDART